jgi:hypothetical protein
MPQILIFLTVQPSLFSWTERLSAGTALPRGGCGCGGYASVLNISNSAPVFV